MPDQLVQEHIKLQLWERLEIEWAQSGKLGLYLTRIEELREDGFVVERPHWVSGEPIWGSGPACWITIHRKDAAYRFLSSIRNSFTKDNKQFYLFSKPMQFERYQRRNYCRIDITFPVFFRMLEAVLAGETPYAEVVEYRAEAVNLSASGALITTPKHLQKGEGLAITLMEPEIGLPGPLIAVVRRVEQTADLRCRAGIEFVTNENVERTFKGVRRDALPLELNAFTERARQRIAYFIFNYQIKLRQKGLI